VFIFFVEHRRSWGPLRFDVVITCVILQSILEFPGIYKPTSIVMWCSWQQYCGCISWFWCNAQFKTTDYAWVDMETKVIWKC